MFSVHYVDYIHEGGLARLTLWLSVLLSTKNNYVLLNRSWSKCWLLTWTLLFVIWLKFCIQATSQPSNIPWCDLGKNRLIYRHRRVGGEWLQDLKRKEARKNYFKIIRNPILYQNYFLIIHACNLEKFNSKSKKGICFVTYLLWV